MNQSTNQQCWTCDVPIVGEPYHAIISGKIYRFCCSAHRQDFRSRHVALQKVEHA